MSKRNSFIRNSPREATTPTFTNPYDASMHDQQMVQQQQASIQAQLFPNKISNNGGNSNSKVVIDDDPEIPQYKLQTVFQKNSQYNCKIVVVGDGGCGKTSLLISYSQQRFPEIYVPTIFENYVTNVLAPNGKSIELALWDTAGQEEYDRLRPLSYPNADLILICFALDSLTSLQNVKDIWYPEVNHFCPGVPVLLVGTKSDLTSDFNTDLPIQLATEINAIGFIECSAKKMFNTSTVFNFALNFFQKQKELQEQYEKTNSHKKRLSKVFNGPGHSRNNSSISSLKKGHFKNLSYDSTLYNPVPEVHADEDVNNFVNPYDNPNKYNAEEFTFTREEKKKRKCTIL
ncbi:GTP-binding protein [Scheffersomyces coipomensis]|uniref:GTP-binding protein n=1 Tax=Scheffersomyces coipomensis TaxID=1788519 RepID=UPI00315C9D34